MDKKLPFSTNSLNFQHFGLRTENSGPLRSKLLLAFALFIVFQLSGIAQTTHYARVNGAWNDVNTWSTINSESGPGTSFPIAGDIVIIQANRTITVGTNAACASINIISNGSAVTNLIVNSVLNVSGIITLQSDSGDSRSADISGSGTLNCASVQIGTNNPPTGGYVTRLNLFTSRISNFNISGNLNISSFAGSGEKNVSNASFNLSSGLLNVDGKITITDGSIYNESTFTTAPATGAQTGTLLLSNANPFSISALGTKKIELNGTGATVNYDGAGQAIRPTDYTNLTVSGSENKTLAATTTVSNNLTMSGTAKLAPSAANIISDGAKVIFNGGSYAAGGFSETLGTITLNDNSTIDLLGTSTTNFANSSALTWTTGKILTINGWTSSSKIFVANTGSALTTTQLSQVKFQIGGSSTSAKLLSTGELQPEDCPTTYTVTGVQNPTVCAGSTIPVTTYFYSGNVTGVTVTNLPAGVTSSIGPSGVTISGTPTSSGTYTLTTTGVCAGFSVSGTITVNPLGAIVYTSGTQDQTVCAGSGYATTVYTYSGSATNANVTNLPTGLNAAVNTTLKTVTVSGIPAAGGTYTVTATGPCANVSRTGSVVINPLGTIVLTSGSQTQTICSGTPFTSTMYTYSGSATNANVSTLPAGLTSTVSTTTKTVTISGTPTSAGTYTVTATGPCANVSISGSVSFYSTQISNNKLTFTNGISGSVSATATENSTPATISAPATAYFASVDFASYGTPTGTAPNFAINPACHSSTSQAVSESYILGNNSATIPASNAVFGDPCSGTLKRVYITSSYAVAICSGAAVTINGSTPTGGGGSFTFKWQRSTTSAITGFADAPGSNTTANYTSGTVSQTSWYRRVVTSCNFTNTSAVIMVKVNPVFSAGVINSTGQVICYNGDPSIIGSATDASGGDGTISYKWQANGVDILGATLKSYDPPSGLTTTTTYTRFAKDNICNTAFVLSSGSWKVTITNPLAPTTSSTTQTFCANALLSPKISDLVATGSGLKWYSAPSGGVALASNTVLSDGSYYASQTVSGCEGTARLQVTVIINSVATPTVGAITNVTCSAAFGTVILSNLPTGSWTINQSGPINTTILGSGTAYTVPNLSAGSYTFTVTTNGCTSAATASVIVGDNSSTTWNGNAWSNGSPTATKNAIIASVTPNSPFATNFTACALTINAGVVVIVPSDLTLTITKGVNVTTDNGLVFENNASLVQIEDVQNTGKITYKRNTTPMRRYDFTYWSSPVAGMTLNQLSPNTLYDKYLKYSNGWSVSVNGVETMNPASGYAVRAPQSFDLTTATVYNAVFEGIPNNGTIEFQLNGTWNLIGNPYPSAVYADEFIYGNPNLYGTLYFWEHNSPPSTLQPGTATYNYNSGDYASYNITGGVGTNSGTAAVTGSKAPSGYIAAGQSFFIAADASLPSVSFKNYMRPLGQNSQFFKMTRKPAVEKNRIWLNLTNEDGLFKQLLIGYLSGATNAYDMVYDGVTYNGNAYADFYSINNGAKLAIQGRAVPFTDEEIPLGFRANLAKKPAVPNSMFTISIDHTDGSLDNQSVFLFDKVENKTHNLRKGDYSFSSADGTFDDRFVLKYTNKTLGVDDFQQQNKTIKVSVKNKVITIDATTHTIEKVLIYDVSGKTIYSKSKINSSVFEIANLRSSDQVLLVKLQLENGITQTTKIIF
ncbi:T9SS sorting signal type C domain-containing protein [Flavobacterium sp. TAB 87]|uniref:T9SS sorting signal type C domain-containing protein n=1 Tax=Flavobacterium sp. TAB 87 TaxID=1729581 RepID=UPI00076CACC2|nr:T9SS sorting signal type C domain-containing protein [Flavobacterium sp. TAB 87]KVV13359.1 Galactose binding lectin domain protein [Flavobacterium sp. TAB 87]